MNTRPPEEQPDNLGFDPDGNEVKAECPCGDPDCPNPGDCDAMGQDDDTE
jgi:hypothetical protein